jgi:hypothetical protein
VLKHSSFVKHPSTGDKFVGSSYEEQLIRSLEMKKIILPEPAALVPAKVLAPVF